MFTTELILRIRDKCPLFERRVGGTASFDAATKQKSGLSVPHAFVIPVEETAEDAGGNLLAQRMRMTFITVVCVDNQLEPQNGKGYAATDVINTARRQLLNALIGWEPVWWSVPSPKIIPGYEDITPNSRADSVRYRGSSFVSMTDNKLWHQFEWSIDYMDSACSQPTVERHSSEVAVVGGTAQAVSPDLPTATTAVVTSVSVVDPTPEVQKLLTPSGQLPTNYWSFSVNPGSLTLNPDYVPDGTVLHVSFEVEQPKYAELLRKLYTEYRPELLDLAGGDATAVSPDMYRQIGDLPPDATVTWDQPSEPNTGGVFADGVPSVDVS